MLHRRSLFNRSVAWLLTLGVLLLPIGRAVTTAEHPRTPLVRTPLVEEARAGGGHPGIAKQRKLLAAKMNLDKGIDPNTPLKDALEFLAGKQDVTIIIDSKAFNAIGIQKVEEQPVHLPKMMGVPLSVVLKLLLAQIKGDEFHGTYFSRPDYIEVSTTAHTFSADRTTGPGRAWLPTVQTDFDRVPLEDALRTVSDLASTNIALDVRVGPKARTPVTARFEESVAVDTAVRLLADMADLKAVAVDSVIYVTTRENAQALEAENPAKKDPFARPLGKR